MQIRRLLTILCMASAIPSAIPAESPPPFPEFQAKRIKPPVSGATGRIKVQIEERANPAVAPVIGAPTAAVPTTADTETAPAQSLYPWFWDVFPANGGETGPGRLEDAAELVSAPSGKESLTPPRLQAMQDIVSRYGRDILLATIGTEVSPAIVLAVIYTESAGQELAESTAGAIGLMQLMPATMERFGVADATVAADNIKGGAAFLDVLLKRYGGDPILALAAYNAGEGAVRDHEGVPPYPETLNYVPRVISAYTVARGLCTSPTLLPSDPCVFAAIAN